MNLSSIFIKAAIAGSLAANFIGISPAIAQVGISPLAIESEAVKGRAQGVLTVINSSDQPKRVRIYSEPFTFNQNGFVSLSSDPSDLSPYLQFSPREVVINAESEQRIRLLGTFPPDFPAGEYRAIIFAEELRDSSSAEANVANVSARVGTTVYMRQGDLSADLSGISVTPDGSALNLLVQNSGQATARPMVRWTLLQAGVEIAKGEEASHTVVTNSDRNIPLTLPEALPAGSYTVSGELVWATLEEPYSASFELPVLIP